MGSLSVAAVRSGEVVNLIKSQHLRIPFTRAIQRVASGDPETLSFEIINSRELLVLGRSTGRTTLVVWFTDGTVQQFVFSVHRELSVLQDASLSQTPLGLAWSGITASAPEP